MVFFLQVSFSLWTLDVTVLVIDMKHAEKRNGKFCCCDDDHIMCQESLNDLGTCEEGNCDIILSVIVSPCTGSGSGTGRHWPCSVSTDEIDDAELFGNNGYYFIFHFETKSQPNGVSSDYNAYIQRRYSYMYVW